MLCDEDEDMELFSEVLHEVEKIVMPPALVAVACAASAAPICVLAFAASAPTAPVCALLQRWFLRVSSSSRVQSTPSSFYC